MSLTNIPQPYLGIWRRTLLQEMDVADTSTFVLWLQTALYHVDIRIPAARPAFNTINHLDECSFEQLSWLATQQGFTGITEVNGNITKWIREHDYQPSNGQRDIGKIKFETDNILFETGIDTNYQEIWEKVPDSHLKLSVKQTTGENRHTKNVPARLFIANSTFAYVRPRNTQLPKAVSLSAAINTFEPSKDVILDWLDFEISFGEITDEDHGYITHSTFPFREGKQIKLS